MTQIETVETYLKQYNIPCGAWQGRRIYLNNHGKDIKAYIEFDSPEQDVEKKKDFLKDAALKVFSNCNQSQNWKLNRCKQVKHYIMEQLQVLGLVDGVPENWERVML